MEPCPACGSTPRTPLLCEVCGRMLWPRTPPTPFEALGLEPSFALDPLVAKKRLLSLSRALHPDVHGGADAATRQLAQDNTATLNAAFQVLVDEARRADLLVKALGGPREDEERSMPAAFLQNVLEWNETIEDARTSRDDAERRDALVALETRLERERAEHMRFCHDKLVPLPGRAAPVLRDVRQRLNAVRYLDRALREIGESRLAARNH